MADFAHIESIKTLVSECETHRKTLVQLQVTDSADPLVLSCSTLEHMYSLANLIDGYCQLVRKTNASLWNKKGKHLFIEEKPLSFSSLLLCVLISKLLYGIVFLVHVILKVCYNRNCILLYNKICINYNDVYPSFAIVFRLGKNKI